MIGAPDAGSMGQTSFGPDALAVELLEFFGWTADFNRSHLLPFQRDLTFQFERPTCRFSSDSHYPSELPDDGELLCRLSFPGQRRCRGKERYGK